MKENIVSSNHSPGILLLAGQGTRLHPLTDEINKNLLPIYDKPLALYSFKFLENSDIKKIIVVTNPKDIDSFANLLESNKKPDTVVYFTIQEKPLGTGDGIDQAKKFITEDQFFSLWGDNLFEFNLSKSVNNHINSLARLHLTRVNNPQDFGVVEINSEGKITRIVDKPQFPKSDVVCTGFMGFKSEVFDIIGEVKQNQKGETDIMDVIRNIHSREVLEYTFIEGNWIDAGVSFDTLLKASILAKESGFNK